ncbi:MAG: hypothetical protein JXA96_06520 [Sedimentisphaerales bacterium]|nr:hypothetical protein [Sedimentisphaerales bacterium]
MSRIFAISFVFLLSIISGCANNNLKSPESKDVFLTVDFQEGKTLRYRFVSERETVVDWNPRNSVVENSESVLNKTNEKLDLVMLYTPLEINPYGLSTIEVTCQEAKVSRSVGAPKDAAEYLNEKTFTFKVDSSGKIHDYSELGELIKQAGQKAFSSGTGSNKIKEPDMIGDFIATQWFLWDSISNIPNAAQGVEIGQSWKSKLSVPTPMVSRLARDVTYKLDEIQPNENIAVINSTYKKSGTVPKSWPVPYTGSFQVRGTFGFLGGYKLLDLAGWGKELFNVELGQIEEYNQQYEMIIEAAIPIGISVNPIINIKQTISMKLIEE